MDSDVRAFSDLANDVRETPGSVRLVGIDGCGGAGKTTFATRISQSLGNAPVVHTDDFASHDEPTEWWPRMLRDVVEPLMRRESAAYRPYDWVKRRPADHLLTVEPHDVVVIEGVGATHRAWRDGLALRIWVDCPRELRLVRGIARDGEEMRQFWLEWMKAEDAYVADEQPWLHADVLVDGATAAPDPETEYVALTALSAPR